MTRTYMLAALAAAYRQTVEPTAVYDPPAPPAALDLDALYELCEQHGVTSMVYQALRATLPAERLARFHAASVSDVYREATMHFELDAVFEDFETAAVDYCPFKGFAVKSLYALPSLRTMTDADVLIRRDDRAKAHAVMERNGFTFTEHTSVHDVYRSPGDLYDVELHDRLLSGWFDHSGGDDWARLTCESGRRYGMNARERYVLAVLHAKKHLLMFGVKARDVLELELLRRAAIGTNAEDELRQADALDWANDLSALAKGWFANSALNDQQRLLGDYIFACNEPANAAQHRLNAENAWYRRNRWTREDFAKLSSYFPPLDQMRDEYRVLRHHPLLLPLCWVARWVVTLARASVHAVRRAAASRGGAIDVGRGRERGKGDGDGGRWEAPPPKPTA